MKKFITNIFYFLLFIPVFAQEKPSFGGQTGPGITTGPQQEGVFTLPNPLKSQSITELLYGILDAVTKFVAAPVAVFMIMVGAFYMLTAGGNPEKFNTGKKTILFAAIGFGILLIADILIGIVLEILGIKADFLPKK